MLDTPLEDLRRRAQALAEKIKGMASVASCQVAEDIASGHNVVATVYGDDLADTSRQWPAAGDRFGL